VYIVDTTAAGEWDDAFPAGDSIMMFKAIRLVLLVAPLFIGFANSSFASLYNYTYQVTRSTHLSQAPSKASSRRIML
jgi:hypothetical protein